MILQKLATGLTILLILALVTMAVTTITVQVRLDQEYDELFAELSMVSNSLKELNAQVEYANKEISTQMKLMKGQ
jgi:peptidoglycan hydrolase CwlO-like protein